MQADPQKTSADAGAYSKRHRVIATNMPFNVADEEILKLFGGAVGVERHAKNGVATGAVFVQCTNSSEVNRFVKTLDGACFKGREIKVAVLHDREVFNAKKRLEDADGENSRGRKRRLEFESALRRRLPGGEEDRTLFVTNISFKDTEEEVAKVFSEHGEVEQCTLVLNRETGEPTGRAFVLYKEAKACKDALKSQVLLNDRVLVVLKYVPPELLRRREEEKDAKSALREKNVRSRKAGRLEPRDPEKLSSCRVHVSHMDKKHTRKSVAKEIEAHFLDKHEKKVKLRGINLAANASKRNPGYCFVTFKFPEDAKAFVAEHRSLARGLGAKVSAEYAMESKEFLERGIKKKPSKADRAEKRSKKQAAALPA